MTVGTRVGGLSETSRAAAEQTRQLSVAVTRQEDSYAIGDAELEASVNVMFDVPGPVVGIDYTGIRTGSWSAKERSQIVQVAVPVMAADELRDFVARALVAAVDLAVATMAKRRTRHPLRRAAAIAAAVAEPARGPAFIAAETDRGKAFLAATPSSIRAAVDVIERHGFLTLDLGGQDRYVQAAFSGDHMVLEYRDGAPEQHYRAAPMTREQVADAMWAWVNSPREPVPGFSWTRLVD
ncbi:hypothetical protein [Saccharothrix sp. HUAS TT1]|uniref:hypothetical protein n=1 Tax=unclassified Saccharothrix TaxID=2593673 RepID=UPI00345C34B4